MNDHTLGIDVDDRPHLQVGGRDRLTVDDQPPRPIAVGARHQRVGRRHHAGSRHQLDPCIVVVGERSGRRSRGDIDDQHLEITLVARLHHDGQCVLGPVDLGQIREPVAVPGHLGRSAPVDRDEMERDLRVGRPGGGVADGSRWQRRLGRIGDVPHLHVGDVDAAGRDRGSIRAPPVAALALHLLGGDEVGAAPRDGGGLLGFGGQHAWRRVDSRDAQHGARDERHRCSEWVRAWIEHRPGDLELARHSRHEIGEEQAPGKGEGGDGDRGIGGERSHAASTLTCTFPPSPLLGRQPVERVAVA